MKAARIASTRRLLVLVTQFPKGTIVDAFRERMDPVLDRLAAFEAIKAADLTDEERGSRIHEFPSPTGNVSKRAATAEAP
jgi:hypothetical protein